jgi:hypothetical protein
MRKLAALLLSGLALYPSGAVVAQNAPSDLMWETYQHSMVDNNQFDNWVAANASRFDSRFQQCLLEKAAAFQACAQQKEAICQQLPSADLQRSCRAQNQCAGFFIWSASIAAKIQNGTPWLQTIQGQTLQQQEALCTYIPDGCTLVYRLARQTYRQNEGYYRNVLACK